MGKRGPKPTPTPILRLHGSQRAASRSGEPEPPAAIPEPPSELKRTKGAIDKYRQIAEELYGMRVLTRVDGVALALLVEEIFAYRQAREAERIVGPVHEGKEGPRLNPATRARRIAFENVLKLCREFGMTPAARTAVRIVGDDERDTRAAKQKSYIA